MQPLLTFQVRRAIDKGDARRLADLMPAFLDKTRDDPDGRNALMFEAARHSLYQTGGTSASLFQVLLSAGLDPNARKTVEGVSFTPLSLVVALHGNMEDLPEGLDGGLRWSYVMDRQNWSNGPHSPRVAYHPQVVDVLLRGGADPEQAPLVQDWTRKNWHLDTSSVASVLKEAARWNNNPDPIAEAQHTKQESTPGFGA